MTQQKIALIGVPSGAGSRALGHENAPERLREAGLVQTLEALGCEVLDMGDLAKVAFSPDPDNPRQQNIDKVVGVLREVAAAVDTAIQNDAWPLVIGGDCSIAIGVLAALTRRYPELGLAYVDGDVDLNVPETTPSGIIDGMVMAHILGRGADDLRKFGARCPLLDEEQVALFGYSATAGKLDPFEVETLDNSRLLKFPFEDIVDDVTAAATSALEKLRQSSTHFLVHFDVDVIDRDDFPAVDFGHHPGLSRTQATEALRRFTADANAVGLIVAEFNADKDADGSCASQLLGVIEAAVEARVG